MTSTPRLRGPRVGARTTKDRVASTGSAMAIAAVVFSAILAAGCAGPRTHDRPRDASSDPGVASAATPEEAAPEEAAPDGAAPDEAARAAAKATAAEPARSGSAEGSTAEGETARSAVLAKASSDLGSEPAPDARAVAGGETNRPSVAASADGGLPIGRPILTTLSNDGGYWIVAAPSPPDVPLNETFALDVWLFDGNERSNPADPETGLTVDADMPAHRHGMVRRPRVVPIEPGKFRVEGMRLHMPGRWQIYFDVRRRGITERAQIDLDLEG